MTRFDEFPFGQHLSLHELTDASNECCHGRLPFDRTPPCGCWNVSWKLRRHPTFGRPRPTYSWHVQRRAVQLYESGLSTRQIARRFGASQRTVLQWIRAAGVPVRERGRPWPDRKAA